MQLACAMMVAVRLIAIARQLNDHIEVWVWMRQFFTFLLLYYRLKYQLHIYVASICIYDYIHACYCTMILYSGIVYYIYGSFIILLLVFVMYVKNSYFYFYITFSVYKIIVDTSLLSLLVISR